MAIEIASTKCFFETETSMKADSVALCIHKTAQHLQQADFQKVIFYLDQNSTHKIKMKYNLALLDKLNIVIEFRYIPSYSPKLNIVEYLIHRIRQKKLHHAPHSRNLKDVVVELKDFLHLKLPFSVDSIYNTFDHIRKYKQIVAL